MARINPDTLDLQDRIVRTNKVQKTTKGGRTMSWSSLIVVGDGEGHVGAGLGKARAIPDAIRKGTEDAKKQLILVPMVDGTIPHEVLADHGATTVLLKPAAPGTGVVAGGAVRILLEAAGVRDVLAKSIGSNNPVNNAWATINALKMLRTVEQVAQLRGKTVEEIRRGSTVGTTVAPTLLNAVDSNAKTIEPVAVVTPEPEAVAVETGATMEGTVTA
ncbi:MAG: 30S ribosomal protein S5 [Armatimonadetes bacterium]|nr:30S ribosomal protein S5 [Armatimonadota bacterium]